MKNLTLIFLVSLFLLPNLLQADNEVISAKCQEIYRTCFQEKLKEIWSAWDWWNAGQLMLSNEEWDKKQGDLIFEMLACDEVAAACVTDSISDTEGFLSKLESTPDIKWEIADPMKEGIDATTLNKAIEEAKNINQLRSFLVAKNGKLVIEEYFDLKGDPRPQRIQSATKSITSLLIGIAIDKGFIDSEAEAIKSYFPEYFAEYPDEEKENITIQQLLTMSSRLNFVDNSAWSKYENTKSWSEPGAYKAYWFADNARDQALGYELVKSDDDQVMLYSTPACDLLTTVIRRSTGMTSKDFADKYLFSPLGIKNYLWIHDSAFNYHGGFTIFLRPRALARIGQMVLDGGRVKDQQIVSQSWLDTSFRVYVPEFVTMDTIPTTVDYGYLWYVGSIKGYKYRFAWGYGGQFIFMIPEANTLVVTTAYPEPDGQTHWDKSQQIIKSLMRTVIEALPKKR